MYICPNCNVKLIYKNSKIGTILYCPKCCGIAVSNIAAFDVNNRLFTQIWDMTANGLGLPGKPCPYCNKEMIQFPLRHDNSDNNFLVDVCPSSQIFWLDDGEIDKAKNYQKDYTIRINSDDLRLLGNFRKKVTDESPKKGQPQKPQIRPLLYGISGSLVGYVVYIFFSSISSVYFYASIGLLLGLIDGIVDGLLDGNYGNIIGKTLLGLCLVPFFSVIYGNIGLFSITEVVEYIMIGFSSGLTYSFGKRFVEEKL
ncbi:MAG: zf-TFIIB domain-containing protein [Spirochaetes bacterium]|jgi:Zn-finger nucleic acid-binding protein|nr:zf-TFIIB domain-containing protein [Spirochaetota bacterium]